MISAYNSALSALNAFGTKIQSNANNIANANTDSFKRTRVNLASLESGGVQAKVEQTSSAGPTVYRQGSQGEEYVELANVDLATEIPEMSLNSRMYSANLKTISTANDMLDSLLDLKA